MTIPPHPGTPSPSLPVDPVSGRVAVRYPLSKKHPKGEIKWLHGCDAKEQLARAGCCVLATAEEAPPTVVAKPTVDWSVVPFEKLRGFAQDAGVVHMARSRAQIEEDLTLSGFIPPVPDQED